MTEPMSELHSVNLAEYVEILRKEIEQLREARDHLDAQNRTPLQQKNAMQAERDEALAAVGKAVKSNCDEALLQQLSESKAQLERLRQDLNDPPGDVQELVIKKLNLVSADSLAQSQAREAVMRRFVFRFSGGSSVRPSEGSSRNEADKIILTDSGSSFLAQYREMRTLLDLLKYVSAVSFSDWKNYDDWAKRRDAVLEATKGLV